MSNILNFNPRKAGDTTPQTPYHHFKEAGYPPEHHAADIQAIKQVIRSKNSLFVLGLSGSGKSSVLRFMVSNPAVQSRRMLFVYIDCNGLDWERDSDAVQEEICRQIIDHLLIQWPVPRPEGRAKQALRAVVREVAAGGPPHLVVVFDRSELLQSSLDKTFFDYLRALRDINPGLSYIFSGRELTPEAFGELTDLLWNDPHWIGGLATSDARMAIDRHAARLGLSFGAAEKETLLACAGRHPALLKYACELAKTGKIDLDQDETVVIEQLLAAPVIKRQCRDMWQDFDLTTQEALRHIARGEKVSWSPTTERLVRAGTLDGSRQEKVTFTSPLFKGYVAGLGPPPLVLQQGLVFKGSRDLALSREEYILFKALWEVQPHIVTHDEISNIVWPAEEGVAPQMITTLVKRLRDKLGDKGYIDSVRGRGYRFLQGAAPLPRNSETHTSS